ncbi:MAG: GAF domain-containing protein [Verrucomicrobiota bacterium]
MNSLNRKFEHAGKAAAAQCLSEAFDGVARRVLINGFNRVKADEGTLWIANLTNQNLIPIFNSGPNAADFVSNVRQPLGRGVVSMVFHSGQPFCENEVFKNATHDQTIDKAMHQVTAAMIAVPFFFANHARGVISCVKLGEGEFEVSDLNEIQHSAIVLERLVDCQLMESIRESEEE